MWSWTLQVLHRAELHIRGKVELKGEAQTHDELSKGGAVNSADTLREKEPTTTNTPSENYSVLVIHTRSHCKLQTALMDNSNNQ